MEAQFLIWQATVLSKQLGMEWLYLDGLSEGYAIGNASFKLGMSGEWYELIGECWKW